MIVLVFGSQPVCKHQTIYKSTGTRRNIKKIETDKVIDLELKNWSHCVVRLFVIH